jgi:hypothetical protein
MQPASAPGMSNTQYEYRSGSIEESQQHVIRGAKNIHTCIQRRSNRLVRTLFVQYMSGRQTVKQQADSQTAPPVHQCINASMTSQGMKQGV